MSETTPASHTQVFKKYHSLGARLGGTASTRLLLLSWQPHTAIALQWFRMPPGRGQTSASITWTFELNVA
jgi:hypothetical protein